METKNDLRLKNERLYKEIENLKKENNDLKKAIDIYDLKLAEAEKYIDYPPSGCTRGPWCEACGFVKHFYVRHPLYSTRTITVCGKGESCKNFVERKDNTDA